MLHRRLVRLSHHGGATGIGCRIFDECGLVSYAFKVPSLGESGVKLIGVLCVHPG
jgi:hypothetical protein